MSKGTQNRVIRIADDDWQMFEAVVELRNHYRKKRPEWTMSDFVRIACMEKVKKMARSRGRDVDIGGEFVNGSDLIDIDVLNATLFSTLENDGANP